MRRTILIEEDDQCNRRLLNSELSLKGYVVLEVANGEDTVNLARKQMPDLILLNTQIPLRLQTARTLKTAKETAEIPVWALTSNDLPREKEKFLEAGCENYIMKPVNTPDLLWFLRRIDERFSTSREMA